eukprot:CAMPEP_0171990920 /NCGR_PEP_ID=MMETSP0993-20121228/277166_1 /TAXON_ID=483369 /ORGANISM="non described non described, Strain CCMP2098" /LENGTH=110 /DNA_ID=CAMNT_0012643937 /DNA_START=50 /DNA_END=382 /DNA_ORIENTATION=-
MSLPLQSRMWYFNLKKMWYLNLNDSAVYNNLNELLVALGFPQGSVVRVLMMTNLCFLGFLVYFVCRFYDGRSSYLTTATPVFLQGQIAPVNANAAAEEPGDGDNSLSGPT